MATTLEINAAMLERWTLDGETHYREAVTSWLVFFNYPERVEIDNIQVSNAANL